MKIPVSFKESEQYIYDYAKSKISPSVYIKELIIEDMKKNNEKHDNGRRKRNLEF
ncbi:hypothetical protein [Clostridium cadaveris]|uniref:hypothetical protein n=1 Tax=Clostridium cadaveris TaxID=1529 RepID=UPI0015B4B923|nr:hypothetical protein [Clostridium cadaveris]NWK10390.1 hypothetical protein [Clostridium cadaveris]